MRPIHKIIVHCSDTDVGTVDSIRRFHIQQRGWSDIGYHYVIYRDGSIHPGRPVFRVGAHCEGENWDSIGICLIGKKSFSEEQFKTLKELVKSIKRAYPTINELGGHRDYPSAQRQGKTCPNFDAKEVLKDV